MEFMVWLLGVALVVVGVIGTVAPLLPGMPLLLCGLLILKVWLPGSPFSWWSIAAASVAVVAAIIVDNISSIVGARMAGGTKWGIAGAAIGCAVGFIFLPVGLIVGPIVGAILGEIFLAQQTFKKASMAGLGAAVGIGAAAIIRFAMGIAVVVFAAADYFF